MINGPHEVILDEPHYVVCKQDVDVGQTEKMTLIHFEVFAFSAQLLKTMLRQWQEIRKGLPHLVFCMPNDPSDPVFDKFVSRFGWKLHGEIPCTDGKVRKLFIHVKDCIPNGRELVRYPITTSHDQ